MLNAGRQLHHAERRTFHWVLAFAYKGLSTPKVFRELDRLRATAGAARAEPARLGDPEPMLANVIALGETSCLIETAEPLSIGSTVHVELALPGGEPLRLHAIVLSADQLQLHHACELLDDDAEVRTRIRLFLAHVAEGG